MFIDLELDRTRVMHSHGTRSNSHGGKHGVPSPLGRGCSRHANVVANTKVASLREQSRVEEATAKPHINFQPLARVMASILHFQALHR